MCEIPFEIEFLINLTYRCNLSCEMCTQYGNNFKENAKDELEVNSWISFLDTIKDLEPKPKIILMGGEPFLYKDIDKLILYAADLGINAHIITNGFFLDKYLDILKNTNTCITISIDGNGDTHDKIRGQKGLYNKIISTLDKIQELQKQGSNLKLKINHVLLPDNIDNIISFHNSLKKYSIETFTFQHLQFSDEKLNKITQEEWKRRLNIEYENGLITKKQYTLREEFIENLKNNLEKFKIYCDSTNCYMFPALEYDELNDYYANTNLDKLRTYRICTSPWLHPVFHPNGDVSNCIGNIIGNITEDNFWDIWNNDKADKLRNDLIENGKFTICTKCCNFYKGNFIVAKNGKLNINNKEMTLPDELNFIQSSREVAFIKDTEIQEQSDNDTSFVYPINIHNAIIREEILQNHEIINIIK